MKHSSINRFIISREIFGCCGYIASDFEKQFSGEIVKTQKSIEINKNDLIKSLKDRRYDCINLPNNISIDDRLFVEATIDFINELTANDYSNLIINGDVNSNDERLNSFDGLLKLFKLDDKVIHVNNTDVTVSNLLVELNKIYVAIPIELKSITRQIPCKLKFAVSHNIYDAYLQSLINAGVESDLDFNFKHSTITYLGYEVVCIPELPDNEAFATYPYNIAVYSDTSPQVELKAIEDRLRLNYKIGTGVEYIDGSHIVYYHQNN